MTTFYFSYSCPDWMTLDSPEPLKSPYSHTWHLGRFLRDKAHEMGWDFRYVNLDDTNPVELAPDDIVLFHAWFDDGCFGLQVAEQDCKAKFIIQPYTELMVGKEALPKLHKQWSSADHLFLTCGAYWFDRMPQTEYAQYHDHATRIDNAVNADKHAFHKHTWNAPGKRGVLAIGYDNPIKGMDKVEELARVGGLRLLHLGSVADGFFEHVPQVVSISGLLFDDENINWICQHYDFFITMGRYDANPTTLSETALWGLVPCCTEQSGYYQNEPFIGLKLDDLAYNLDMMEWLQYAPAPELDTHQKTIRDYVSKHHTHEARHSIIWNKILEFVE